MPDWMSSISHKSKAEEMCLDLPDTPQTALRLDFCHICSRTNRAIVSFDPIKKAMLMHCLNNS